jgi:hypothetical protein
MKRAGLSLALLICATGAASSASYGELGAAQAKDHVGETATVCGVVASANYATRSKRQPTFLNLDKAYPDHIFTAVIFGEDRSKFGAPETELKDKRICVTGKIQEFQGKPEIILSERAQLKVKDK